MAISSSDKLLLRGGGTSAHLHPQHPPALPGLSPWDKPGLAARFVGWDTQEMPAAPAPSPAIPGLRGPCRAARSSRDRPGPERRSLPCPAPLCCEPRPRSAAIKPRCIYSIRPPRSSLLLPLLPSFLARPSFSQSSRCFLLYLSCFSAGSVSGEGWEMNV